MGIFRRVSRPTYDDAARRAGHRRPRCHPHDLHAAVVAAEPRHLDRGLDPVGGEFHRPAGRRRAGRRHRAPNGPRQGHHAAPGGATTMVEHPSRCYASAATRFCVIAAPGPAMPAPAGRNWCCATTSAVWGRCWRPAADCGRQRPWIAPLRARSTCPICRWIRDPVSRHRYRPSVGRLRPLPGGIYRSPTQITMRVVAAGAQHARADRHGADTTGGAAAQPGVDQRELRCRSGAANEGHFVAVLKFRLIFPVNSPPDAPPAAGSRADHERPLALGTSGPAPPLRPASGGFQLRGRGIGDARSRPPTRVVPGWRYRRAAASTTGISVRDRPGGVAGSRCRRSQRQRVRRHVLAAFGPAADVATSLTRHVKSAVAQSHSSGEPHPD